MDSMATDVFVMEVPGSPDGKTLKLKGGHHDPIEGSTRLRSVTTFPPHRVDC
jgi:hypothetical protein